ASRCRAARASAGDTAGLAASGRGAEGCVRLDLRRDRKTDGNDRRSGESAALPRAPAPCRRACFGRRGRSAEEEKEVVMRCDQIRPYLPGFVGGDLRPDTGEVVAAHAAMCVTGHAESAALERARARLARVAVLDVWTMS